MLEWYETNTTADAGRIFLANQIHISDKIYNGYTVRGSQLRGNVVESNLNVRWYNSNNH
jgi:hypothetical protein